MVGTYLTLVILSTTVDPSLYLDIPIGSLETIEQTDSESQPLSQALNILEKSVQYCLRMRLKPPRTENHYLNAKGGSADSITLVFDDSDDSKLVNDAIIDLLGETPKASDLGVISSAVFELPSNASRPLDPDSVSYLDNAHVLSEIASDAVTAMRDQSLEQDTLAANTEAQDKSWHGLESRDARLSEERALGTDPNTDQHHESDLRMNGSTLPTSPFDSRVSASRVLNVSFEPAAPQNAPQMSQKLRTTENQASMDCQQESGSTATNAFRGSKNLDEGQASERHGSWDALYDVSPNRSEVIQPQEQDVTAAFKVRSQKQAPLQAIASEPRKKKLSQQMRDESGRTASGTAELARESAQKIRGADYGRRLSGPSEAASVNSKKARYGDTAKSNTKAIGSRTHKRSGRTRKDQEEDGVGSASALRRPRHLSTAVQRSVPSHTTTSAMRKTIENEALDKPSKPLTQVSKSQVKRHQGPKPIKTTGRDSVNYDEAFEPDGDDVEEGDRYDERPSAKGSKRGKTRKAPVGQKRIKRTPARPRPPKASVPPVSLATRKPRRTAAVKANKAIQGIADHDVVEDEIVDDDIVDDEIKTHSDSEPRPSIPSIPTAKSPAVARPTRTLPHFKPSTRRLPIPPSATSHITSKTPAFDSTRVPRPAKNPRDSRSSAPGPTHSVAGKAFKNVEPSKFDPTTAPASPITTTGTRPLAPMSPLPPTPKTHAKTSSVPAEPLTAATAAAEDMDEIEASPDQDPVMANPFSSPNEYSAPKKVISSIDALSRPVNSTHNKFSHSEAMAEVTQPKPYSQTDDHVKTQPIDDQAQPPRSDTGLGNVEKYATKVAEKGAPTHGKESALSPQNDASAELSAFTSAAPSISDPPVDPTQAHFEEAMAFALTPGRDLSSDPLQAPMSHQILQTKPGQGSFQLDARRDSKIEKITTSTRTPLRVSETLITAKLQSALSAIPQMHPETITKHRAIPTASMLPLKGRSPALRKETPETATLNPFSTLAQPMGSHKRPQHLEDTKKTKRSKPLITEDDTYLRLRDHAADKTTPKGEQSKNIHRKPNIVHFEPTGPSNQGSSTRRPELAMALEKPVTETRHQEIEYRSKRKHVDDAKDVYVKPRLLPQKRQKLHYRDEPKEAVEQAPILLTKAQRASNVEQQRKASSQSSRVDEFGSPQPYQHARTTTITQKYLPPRPPAKQSIAWDDDLEVDENLAPYDDEASDFPGVPLPTNISMKKSPRAGPPALISINSKHRPSSPLAPSSIITGLAAHEERADGNLVVVRTAEIVVLKKPQDPFVEATLERSNSFMDLLRKSSGKRVDKDQAKPNGPPCIGHDISDDPDPEKTLIGASDPDDEDASSTASETSSESDDSSSGERELSDDGNVLAWQRALQPHQKATLDVLIEISHVGSRLITGPDADNTTACD